VWQLLKKGIPCLDTPPLGLPTASGTPPTSLGLTRGGRAVASAVLGRAVVLVAMGTILVLVVLIVLLVLVVVLVAIQLTACVVVEARGGHTSTATH